MHNYSNIVKHNTLISSN